MDSVTVSLEWPLREWPNSNADRKKHWAVQRKEARAIRTIASTLALQALAKCEPFTKPVHLTASFGFPDRRPRDLDNYSLKAYIDGIVDGGLLRDDNLRQVVSVTRVGSPERSPKGQIRVTLTITEAEELDGNL